MENEEEIVDLDDIFEDYGAVPEENLNHDRQNEDGSNDQANADNSEALEAVPAPKKRVIKNPRLKFDPDRLCGPRGIPVLIDHFKDIKFKGKGHEAEDLDCLLSTLEHWTHRLFPSMKFVDTLKHIEKLGKKRPVQTCLQKIRLDMPILSADFIKEVEESVDAPSESFDDLNEPESAFDRLLRDQQVVPESHEVDDDISRPSQPIVITEEQRLRMEQNKQRAAERLRARLSAMNSSVQDNNANETASEALNITNESESILNIGMSNNVLENNISKLDSVPLSPDPCGKPAKRLRILSDSDESCDLDALVENTMANDDDPAECIQLFPPSEQPKCSDEIHKHSDSLENEDKPVTNCESIDNTMDIF